MLYFYQLVIVEKNISDITWQTEMKIYSACNSEKAHVSMEWIYDFLSKKNILR